MKRRFSSFDLYSRVLVLLISIACVYSAALLLSLDPQSILYFGDAAAHLVRARQYIDSQQTGLHSMGTVWLPLPHILLIPFVASDYLFFHGLSAVIPGTLMLLSSALLFNAILRRCGCSPLSSLIASLLCFANPNLVYIALTPMNEMTLLFFVVLAAFCFVRFLQEEKTSWMLSVIASLSAATLCRYEAWALVPILFLYLLAVAVRQVKVGERRSGMLYLALAFSSCVGPTAWFLWNYSEYGDALAFAHMTYSIGSVHARSVLSDNLIAAFAVGIKAIALLYGPVILLASFVSIILTRAGWRRPELPSMLMIFSAPALFNIVAIIIGFVQIDTWWWNWRYFLSLGTLFSVLCAVIFDWLFARYNSIGLKLCLPVLVFAYPVLILLTDQPGVVVYSDAKKAYDSPSKAATKLGAEFAQRVYVDSVDLFVPYGAGQRFMLAAQSNLNHYRIRYYGRLNKLSFDARYFVCASDSSSEMALSKAEGDSLRAILDHAYVQLLRDEYMIVYERNDVHQSRETKP